MLSAKDLVSHVVLPSTVTDLVNRIATGRLSTKSDYVSYCVQTQNSQPERENISPEKHHKRRHSSHKDSRNKSRETNYGPFKYSSKSKHKHSSSKLNSNGKYLSYSGSHSNVVKSEVQCPDCGILFHSEVKLPSNILNSNQEKQINVHNQRTEVPKQIKILPVTLNAARYECKICNRMFTNKDTYNKHLKYHMQGQKYKCSQCTESFQNKNALIEHYVVHKVHICIICNKHFPDNWKLTRHMKTHWGNKCGKCKKTFPDKRALEAHVATHKTKECSIVLKQTDISKQAITSLTGETFENVMSPEKSNVSKQIVTYTTEAMYESDISPEKFNILNKIVTQTTGEATNVSPEKSEINTPTVTQSLSTTFESDIHPEKFSVVKYIDSPPAETCESMCIDKINPMNFMIVNTTSETPKTDISVEKSNITNQVVELASNETMNSNSSFQNSSLLENIKNFIQKQQEITNKKLQFTDFYKGHSVDGRHHCTLCTKSFKDKGKLKQHMVIHTGEKSHMCNLCGKKFYYKWRLTQHFKTHTNKSCVSITDVTQEENEVEIIKPIQEIDKV